MVRPHISCAARPIQCGAFAMPIANLTNRILAYSQRFTRARGLLFFGTHRLAAEWLIMRPRAVPGA